MTIQELEMRTGLTRANIRYYEKEGLLKVARLENGYRDYSEENVRELNRIILLRKLHFTIEELKILVGKGESLENLLRVKQEELQGEAEELVCAQKICMEMAENHVEYKTLDCEYYLNQFEGERQEEKIAENDVVTGPGHPWRRFIAYTLDYTLYGVILYFVAYHLLDIYPPQQSLLVSMCTSIILSLWMIPFDTVLMIIFGTTSGKFLMGIRVTHDSGRKLTVTEAFIRNLGRFIYGEGCSIPMYGLYKNIKCFQASSKGAIMRWDEDVAYEIKDSKMYKDFICVAVCVAVTFLNIAVQVSGTFPKRKDDGTVQTFVKNYNEILAHVYGVKSVQLDEDGYLRIKRTESGMDWEVILLQTGQDQEKIKMVEFSEKDGKLSQITVNRSYDFEGLVLIDQAYNETALYTAIASQKGFHVFDYFQLSNFFEKYEQNSQDGEYHDSFKNVSFEQTVVKEGEGCQVTLEIKMN